MNSDFRFIRLYNLLDLLHCSVSRLLRLAWLAEPGNITGLFVLVGDLHHRDIIGLFVLLDLFVSRATVLLLDTFDEVRLLVLSLLIFVATGTYLRLTTSSHFFSVPATSFLGALCAGLTRVSVFEEVLDLFNVELER